jgi:hypothetical protein
MMRVPQPTRLLTIFLAGMIPLVSISALAKQPVKATASKTSGTTNIRMYRYTNNAGVLVTGNSISPEYARKGYQVVAPNGEVLETIAPEPTKEERAQYEQKAKDKLTAAKQTEQDKELLLRYSTLDEIKLAKERKLTEIDNKIRMLNSNITTLNQQIDFQQQSAAGFERDGQAVPIPVLSKIEALHQEMKISENQLADRKKEYEGENARFAQETERFIYLESKRSKH